MKRRCSECKYFFNDNRITDYRRDRYCFCRKKGAFFSRNYRIGEKTRIDPNAEACMYFEVSD